MTASSAEIAAKPPESPARAARRVAFWSRLNAGAGSGLGTVGPDLSRSAAVLRSTKGLDRYLRGGTVETSVDARPERSSTYADPKTTAEVCRIGNQEGRPRPIPGARGLDRQPNGPETERTESLQHHGGGGEVSRRSRGDRKGRATSAAAVRLRRAMGIDQ